MCKLMIVHEFSQVSIAKYFSSSETDLLPSIDLEDLKLKLFFNNGTNCFIKKYLNSAINQFFLERFSTQRLSYK